MVHYFIFMSLPCNWSLLSELLPAIRTICYITSVRGTQVRNNPDCRCLVPMHISCNSLNVFLLEANLKYFISESLDTTVIQTYIENHEEIKSDL